MALDDRADAVTTVDPDEADTAFAARAPAPVAPADGVDPVESENGSSSGNGVGHDDVPKADAPPDTAKGDPRAKEAAAVDLPDPVPGNGTAPTEKPAGRAGRKRTARQRTLLVAEGASAEAGPDPTGDAASSPVDPLLAAAEPTEDGAGKDRPGSSTAASTIGVLPGRGLHPTEPGAVVPPSTTAATAAAAAAAAALYAPSPSRTAPIPIPIPTPLPALAPASNGLTETEVLPAPAVVVVPPPPRPRRRARPRVRKVTRIVRSVDAWSVFKVAAIFFLAMGIVLITAGVLLWNLAQSTGTLDNVEGFFREAFNYDTFKLESEPLFRAGLTLTALFVVAGTGLTVVMAVLFNLIADLTGGIRLTVLEREVVARDDQRGKRRRRKQRPVRAPAPTADGQPPAPPPAAMPPAPDVPAPRPG